MWRVRARFLIRSKISSFTSVNMHLYTHDADTLRRGLYVDIPAAQAKCKKERQITTSTATIFLLDPLSILLHSTYWEVDEPIPSAKQLMVADLEPPIDINSSWSWKLIGITIKFASNKSQKNLTWWRFGMIWSTLGAIVTNLKLLGETWRPLREDGFRLDRYQVANNFFKYVHG